MAALDLSFLDRLRAQADAELACAFRVVSTSRGARAVALTASSRDGAIALERASCAEGVPDLSRPSMRAMRGFFEVADPEPTAFPWIDRRLISERRCVVYRARSLIGCVSIFHRDHAPLRARKRRAWRSLRAELESALIAQDAEDRAYETLRGQIVAAEDGRIELASWSLQDRVAPEDVARAIEAARSSRFAESAVVRGSEMRVSPLYAAQRSSLLIEVSPAPPIALAPDAWLTPMQRRVAVDAATGATVGEISKSIHSGAETVRSHLREVYRRLGVASRLELAQVLEGTRSYAGDEAA